MKSKHLLYLPIIIGLLLTNTGCKKEKNYSLVGKWTLKQTFDGYVMGGSFTWKDSPDPYFYDIRTNNSIYTSKFIACTKGTYSASDSTINMTFDCVDSSNINSTSSFYFINSSTLVFHHPVIEGYIEEKFFRE